MEASGRFGDFNPRHSPVAKELTNNEQPFLLFGIVLGQRLRANNGVDVAVV